MTSEELEGLHGRSGHICALCRLWGKSDADMYAYLISHDGRERWCDEMLRNMPPEGYCSFWHARKKNSR